MGVDRPILFTGFEPSGDDHAAAVVRELLARHPDLKIYAWGGPKIEAAGAEIVERTGDDAVMGLPGLKKIAEHRKINRRIAEWMAQHRPALHVPVDSPAANFPVCKLAKERGARVVHLVAPQVWAWGKWRVNKLRKLTDHVLCLLPFEESWFRERNVMATFVGHPLFDHPVDTSALDTETRELPSGDGPRVAIMPGSRPGELSKNFATLVDVYRLLEAEHPGMTGVVAAAKEADVDELRRHATAAGRAWPASLAIVHGKTDAVIRWCDLSLVVSGTVTLQIARQTKPMVIMYRPSRIVWSLIARWLISTTSFSLPNLIAGRRIVREFIPHFAGPEPIAGEAIELLESNAKVSEQRRDLAEVCAQYAGTNAARASADVIERVLGLDAAEPAESPVKATA